MNLADEKYMAFTTYRKNGVAVTSPVWVVPVDGGKVGFWTSSASGKAKRLAHTAKITMQPSDVRGRVKPGSVAVTGTAVLSTGPELAELSPKLKKKYGVMVPISKLFNTVGHIGKGSFPYADRAVIITLD